MLIVSTLFIFAIVLSSCDFLGTTDSENPTTVTNTSLTTDFISTDAPNDVTTEKPVTTTENTTFVETYSVTYYDWDGTVLFTDDFEEGADLSGIVEPIPSEREDLTFDGWTILLPEVMPNHDIELLTTYVLSFVDPKSFTGAELINNIGTEYDSLTQDQVELLNSRSDVTGYMPSTGTNNILVVLVEFSDVSHLVENTPEHYENILFNDISPYSMTSFYEQQSYQQLSFTGDVSDWITLSQTREYYESVGEEQTNSIAYTKMINEALPQVVSQGYNLSDYDNDGDGILDGLYLVMAGLGGSTRTFWGYVANYYGVSEDEYGGSVPESSLSMYRYAAICEWMDYTVFAHETGHMMGLADYYDLTMFDEAGIGANMYNYELMNNNDLHLSPVSKFLLGWIDPVFTSDVGTYDLGNIAESKDVIFYNPSYNGNIFTDFFVLFYYENEFQDSKGIMVMYVNMSLNKYAVFAYDNSVTENTFIRVIANNKEKSSFYYESLFDVGDKIENGSLYSTTFNDYNFFSFEVKSYDEINDTYEVEITEPIDETVNPYIYDTYLAAIEGKVGCETFIRIDINEAFMTENGELNLILEANGVEYNDSIYKVVLDENFIYIKLIELMPDTDYDLIIPSGALTDYSQNTNDELVYEFHTDSETEPAVSVTAIYNENSGEEIIGYTYDNQGTMYVGTMITDYDAQQFNLVISSIDNLANSTTVYTLSLEDGFYYYPTFTYINNQFVLVNPNNNTQILVFDSDFTLVNTLNLDISSELDELIDLKILGTYQNVIYLDCQGLSDDDWSHFIYAFDFIDTSVVFEFTDEFRQVIIVESQLVVDTSEYVDEEYHIFRRYYDLPTFTLEHETDLNVNENLCNSFIVNNHLGWLEYSDGQTHVYINESRYSLDITYFYPKNANIIQGFVPVGCTYDYLFFVVDGYFLTGAESQRSLYSLDLDTGEVSYIKTYSDDLHAVEVTNVYSIYNQIYVVTREYDKSYGNIYIDIFDLS